ncbi:MAG: DUF1385 domain-containing protein [Clostridia bacterium]|nr:DUF1385 domain-containing protein [Clostridia bacterium]MBQ2136133.1 DUF1385 domain-containing protein [Clostridia bacterium]MBQ2237636.1 DUF1385 domain-containing protein [Clostridia bacterium]
MKKAARKPQERSKIMAKYTSIGGQALIEGIMMKSPEKTALAVRMPNKEIDISYFDEKSIKEKYKILGLPIIRGVVGFVESMIQGYKAMMISADKSGFTDFEEEEAEEKMSEEKKNLFVSIIMVIGVVLGVALAVVLFMLLPRLVVSGLRWIFQTDFSPVVRSSIEQLIKLSVFVLYVWLVSFMKDIKRVFMYHGAEHKTIFCYEKGLELTVENVRQQKRFHPRCGTSFMILMILISIIFSTVVQLIFPSVYNIYWLWVAVKILLVPIVCGAGYEVLKICGRYDNIITKIISAPGLWLQRITTCEPEDDMIEIAIAALKACEPENPDVDRSIDKKEENTNDNI